MRQTSLSLLDNEKLLVSGGTAVTLHDRSQVNL